jgi:hypothetical protein
MTSTRPCLLKVPLLSNATLGTKPLSQRPLRFNIQIMAKALKAKLFPKGFFLKTVMW